MNNHMPTNWKTLDKFLENYNLQDWIIKKYKIWTDWLLARRQTEIKDLSKKQKFRTRWIYWLSLLNIQRIDTNPSQMLPKNRGGNTSKLILLDQHHPNSKNHTRILQGKKNYWPIFLMNIDTKIQSQKYQQMRFNNKFKST